ncbi:MAG: DUF3696 domain-containing protein [Candidatus Aminicenantes bacterium]|nr:DUF3696 domain-containing protein [Candidatus Aminicenantes bacterium]
MISYIYIENFKVFTRGELNLAPLTLLTGLNGMGKTTFIQSLLLLRQSYEKKSLPDEGLLLNGDYVEIGKGKDAYCMDGVGEHIRFEIEWQGDKCGEAVFDFSYATESDVQPIKSFRPSENFDPFSTSLFNKNFQYLTAERITPRTQFPISEYRVKQLHALGNKGEYTVHFIAAYQRSDVFIENLIHPAAKTRAFLAQLDSWMKEIAPGISINAEVHSSLNMAKLGYKFEVSRGFTDEFNPVNVGFGITYALPVVTAILSSKPGDLLIIENPESHLHPAGQAVIGKLCALAAGSGVQIILESHSDHILNSIRVAVRNEIISPELTAVYYFERDPNADKHKVDIIKPIIDENGRIDKKPTGFFDEWTKQLDQLIS